MKKYYLVMALFLVCALLTSCGNNGKQEGQQKEDFKQKAAIELLKRSLKSPSSFELINIIDMESEAHSTYDTLYHVKKINETAYYDMNVVIDSIQIWRTDYPDCMYYLITYDAANSYGAILRGNESIYVTEDNMAYFSVDFIYKYKENKVLDHTEKYDKTYKNVMAYGVKKGTWISKIDLGIY